VDQKIDERILNPRISIPVGEDNTQGRYHPMIALTPLTPLSPGSPTPLTPLSPVDAPKSDDNEGKDGYQKLGTKEPKQKQTFEDDNNSSLNTVSVHLVPNQPSKPPTPERSSEPEQLILKNIAPEEQQQRVDLLKKPSDENGKVEKESDISALRRGNGVDAHQLAFWPAFWLRIRAVAFALLCAGVGALTNLLAKDAVQLIATSVNSVNQMDSYVTWLIILSVIPCSLVQLKVMAGMMEAFEAVLIIPIYTCMFIFNLILQGAYYFEELEDITNTNLVFFIISILLTCVGIIILSRSSKKKIEKKTDSATNLSN